MVEFVNGLTGTRMFVSPEREAEYLAAGHIRVNSPPAAPDGKEASPAVTAAGQEKTPPVDGGSAKAPKQAPKRSAASKRGTDVKK